LPFLVPKLVQEYKLKNVKTLLKKIEQEINEASKSNEAEKLMESMSQ